MTETHSERGRKQGEGAPRTAAITDSHAHLELDPLVHDPAGVVQRASAAGVDVIITVGIDIEDAKAALDIVDRFERVFGCVGFHPHNAKAANESDLHRMAEMARHPKVVGYGEIGLDFFRDHSPRDTQRAVFLDQIAMAQELGKPVVIHLRDAYDEGLDILEKSAPFPAGGVIHCFSGNRDDAGRVVALGFHASIPGTVTYKKNDLLRSIVRELPSDRILLETDCPFLAPEPFRGKDNEPALIVHTARKVAEVRGVTYDEICRLTTANAKRVFRLPV